MKWLTSSPLMLPLLFTVPTPALETPSHAEVFARDNLTLQAESPEEGSAISYLASKTRQQDAIFSEAVHLLESMSSSPSCNRIAATRLVTSCQSVGGKDNADRDTYEAMDRIRSVYAARLAICELHGAGASIPSPCLPVTVSPPATKTLFGFATRSKSPDTRSDLVPEELLEQCLKALESRPQWWTSYSNSRQNSMVICQASRIEVEREQLLDLHQSILKSSIKLDEGLQEAIHSAAMETSQHQAFLQAVQALQEKIVTDLEATESLFRYTFGKYLDEIEGGIDAVVAAFASAVGRAHTETAVLEKDIRSASGQVDALQLALEQAHQDAISRGHQALQAHQGNSLAHQELASVLQLSLHSLLETDLARISQSVVQFDASLEWLASRLIQILEREDTISQRLQYMEAAINQSQVQADELHKAQHLQAEALAAQSQAHKAIQFNAQVSQALLDKTAVATANLHALIDKAATKYKQTPGLHFGSISGWMFCIGLLLGILAQNAKVAVSLFALIFGHLIATSYLQLF